MDMYIYIRTKAISCDGPIEELNASYRKTRFMHFGAILLLLKSHQLYCIYVDVTSTTHVLNNKFGYLLKLKKKKKKTFFHLFVCIKNT